MKSAVERNIQQGVKTMMFIMTVDEWRKDLEDGFMKKYNSTRRTVRREYKEFIERDMKKPPSWVKVVPDGTVITEKMREKADKGMAKFATALAEAEDNPDNDEDWDKPEKW